jgi:phosphoribosylformylglycinamidine (FGAM) synthase-like enzyme
MRYPEFGGTQFQSKVSGCNVAPQVRFDEENASNEAVYTLISRQLLSNVHDISIGGLWQTLVEMVIGERGRCEVGLKLDLGVFDSLETALFSENGGYVIALNPDQKSHVISILEELNVSFFNIGHTNKNQAIEIQFKQRNHTIPIQDLIQNWNLGQR